MVGGAGSISTWVLVGEVMLHPLATLPQQHKGERAMMSKSYFRITERKIAMENYRDVVMSKVRERGVIVDERLLDPIIYNLFRFGKMFDTFGVAEYIVDQFTKGAFDGGDRK